MRKNWRRWALAAVISLAAHGAIFTLFLTLKSAPTYKTAAVEVQLLPPIFERRPTPEPEPKSPAPKTAEEKASPAAPAAATSAGEFPTIPGAASETGARPAAGGQPASGGADFVSAPAIHCLDPSLSPADRNECERRRFARRPGERDEPIGLANDTLERDLDRREARVTATSRCEGWASEREMRNIGMGCSNNTKAEGSGTRSRRGAIKRF